MFQIKILKLSYRKVANFEMYHFSLNSPEIIKIIIINYLNATVKKNYNLD